VREWRGAGRVRVQKGKERVRWGSVTTFKEWRREREQRPEAEMPLMAMAHGGLLSLRGEGRFMVEG
jgi:hypothetical protein